jgi:hypothetical protein
MPSRKDVVLEQLSELQQNLNELWVALSTDPKKQARKERAWTMLAGALTVGATMLARRGTAKLWGILTGEPPPVGSAQQPAPQQSRRPEAAAHEAPAPRAPA